MSLHHDRAAGAGMTNSARGELAVNSTLYIREAATDNTAGSVCQDKRWMASGSSASRVPHKLPGGHPDMRFCRGPKTANCK